MKRDWKIIAALGVTFVLMLLLSVVASYIGYQKIDQLNYEQIAGIVGGIVAENPEHEVKIVQALKALDEEDVIRGKEVLEPYGYEDKFLILDVNQRGFKQLIQINMLMMGILFGVILLVVCGMYSKVKQKFNHLLDYLIQMAHGNYTLNIEGIGEGTFSVFEDQIYKTTVSLRESKEIQEKEKLNLAQNLADISHQLKTPLTSMGIMTELLLDNELDEANQQFVGQLDRQIERLSQLVGTLLKLAKLDAGTAPFKAQPIDTRELVEEVLDMLEVVIQQKGIQVSLVGEAGVMFQGDKHWTYEAIHNVIYNGVQHSPLGGELRIEWRQNPIYVEITVQDEGSGILEEDLPHIFTRFYKGQKAAKDSVGIGLAMAKMIIEKQNGEIKAKNVSKGAAFSIKFY